MNAPAVPVVPISTVACSARAIATGSASSRSAESGCCEPVAGRRRRPAGARRGPIARGGRARGCPSARGSAAVPLASAAEPVFAAAARSRCRPRPRRGTGTDRWRRPSAPRRAARRPPRTTAPVPWMSSLKLGSAMAIAVEDAERVVLLEVLPLDDGARETPGGPTRRTPRAPCRRRRLADVARDSRGTADRRAARGGRCRRRGRRAGSRAG